MDQQLPVEIRSSRPQKGSLSYKAGGCAHYLSKYPREPANSLGCRGRPPLPESPVDPERKQSADAPLPPPPAAAGKGSAWRRGSSTPPRETRTAQSRLQGAGLVPPRGGCGPSPGRRPCHSAHSRVRSPSARRKRSSCTTSASSTHSARSQSNKSQLIAAARPAPREKTDRAPAAPQLWDPCGRLPLRPRVAPPGSAQPRTTPRSTPLPAARVGVGCTRTSGQESPAQPLLRQFRLRVRPIKGCGRNKRLGFVIAKPIL